MASTSSEATGPVELQRSRDCSVLASRLPACLLTTLRPTEGLSRRSSCARKARSRHFKDYEFPGASDRVSRLATRTLQRARCVTGRLPFSIKVAAAIAQQCINVCICSARCPCLHSLRFQARTSGMWPQEPRWVTQAIRGTVRACPCFVIHGLRTHNLN